NVPEFIVAYLAIARLRAVMCTLHMPYRGAEIEAILGHSCARLFLDSVGAVTELEDAHPLTPEHPEPDPEDPFLLLYTSGTTACPAAGLFNNYDWSSLRLAIISGSTAPPALVKEFAAAVPQCAVTQLWGMTELQAGLYTRPGDPLEWSATSAGRPSPGAEVRLSGEGEIQVRGPLLFSGYFNNPEEDKAAFTHDGWFRSGDLGERCEGGNIAITGRIKDIINRGGIKFNPADVEKLLDSHPKIMQSAIVPMPDPVLGEKACAFITLRGEAAPSLHELRDYLSSRNIAKNKLPERLVVIPEMPLTPTRKIIKGRLRLPES